jgi:hypothetical protein
VPKPAPFDPSFWLTDAQQHHDMLITGFGGHRLQGAVLPARVTFVIETLAIHPCAGSGFQRCGLRLSRRTEYGSDRARAVRRTHRPGSNLKAHFGGRNTVRGGPRFAKGVAIAHDCSVYGEPLTVRDWRKTVFESRQDQAPL